MRLLPTPSQTIGPFFGFALTGERQTTLVSEDDPGAVRIAGAVRDGEGKAVSDALVEIWQADRAGRYAHPEDARDEVALEQGFTGFGRCQTDDEGCFAFVTCKPGCVPGPGGKMQAPHIEVGIFARGLLKRLVTRIYFPDESEANATDPVLCSIGDPTLRSSLVARRDGDGIRFDIHLQGDDQTAFFDV